MIQEYKQHLKRQGFEIREKIGSGLSGEVFRAFQTSLNRDVAVKFFNNNLSRNDEGLRKRFIRESKLLSELQHPAIPYVLTRGTISSKPQDVPYMVMQYISGKSLDYQLKNGEISSLDKTLLIANQLLEALDFVHTKGIVHRDIKPSNIMMLQSGHCYLIDFSIGYKQEVETGTTRPTRAGDHLGSVHYMSPEQLSCMKHVDGRSDLYSLTKVICELITGKPDLIELDRPDSPLPSALKKVLLKGGAYDAKDRYSTASSYLHDLKQASANTPKQLRQPSKALCTSLLCSSADWSPRGYYRGPYFAEECSNTFCTSCGSELIYACEGCGQPIERVRFCGGCGKEQFTIPECDKCGSYLEKADMMKNTALLGCGKCRRKAEAAMKNIPKSPYEDDIPF